MNAPALATPPHPEHRWEGLAIALIAFGAFIAGIVLMGVHQFRISQSGLAVVGLIATVAGPTMLVILAIRYHRYLLRTQAEAAARLGLTVVRPVSKEQRQAFLKGMTGLNSFRNVARMNWYATGTIDGRPIAACYILTSAGEEGSSLLIAVTPCPHDWPSFEVGRGGKGVRAVYRFASKLLRGRVAPVLEGFDNGLVVSGHDGQGVRNVLNAEVQRTIAQNKLFERWELNNGRLALEINVNSGERWMEWIVSRVASVADHLETHAATNETAPVEPGLRR